LAALTQVRDNLKVEAGIYDIKLFAWCNGKAYAEMTRKKVFTALSLYYVEGSSFRGCPLFASFGG